MAYAPPPYPPPRRPLNQSTSSLYPEIDLNALATNGWVTLPISADDPADPLCKPYNLLFEAAASFFELPEEVLKERYTCPPRPGFQPSEEGFQCIPGEKRMNTVRTAGAFNLEMENRNEDEEERGRVLRERVAEAWAASGRVMCDVLRAVEESLGLPSGTLMRTAALQETLPAAGAARVASLMRVFRYDRPEQSGEMRIVADTHKDLGLLTIVIGHSPGLECWDVNAGPGGGWVSCEAGTKTLHATLLTGQTLAKFTNGRYVAGRHRVCVSANDNTEDGSPNILSDPLYRYSLVHALRAHLPVRVSSKDFETSVTGRYYYPEADESRNPTVPPPGLMTGFADVPISEIYHAISNSHWNVNIGVEERERQRRTLMQRAESASAQEALGRTDNQLYSVPVVS